MARPKGTTKLEIDPTLGQRILTYLRTGSYLETAAEAVGLDASTIHRWLARGAKGQEPFSTFAADVRRATAEAELRDLARIDRAADESWQAAAWKMERRNPKAWGRREYNEVTGADGGPIRYEQLEETELDAEIKRLAAELEVAAGDGDAGEGEA
jgi:hypothetical protein